jgi:signal transduction histidine kinase
MKLLNKTIRSYLVYSSIILLITIPLFYVVVRHVLLHAVDHSLKSQMREIRNNLSSIHSKQELEIWAGLDKDISLYTEPGPASDSIYTRYVTNPRHHRDEDPYREIAGAISVNSQSYKLVISSSLVENEDLLGSIMIVQAILLILLMTGILWINRRTSKKIWMPFYSLLNEMQHYDLNKNNELTLKSSRISEFNELNQVIKNLLNRNYEIYLQQKEFTENASHEMQTPLAIIQGQLELLMQTVPLTEDQAVLISELEASIQRLIRLNKSLLLLTRIENNEYAPAAAADIEEILVAQLDSFHDYLEKRKIRRIEKFEARPVAQCNIALMEILISNLVSNAIRHNITGGTLLVETGPGFVTISNTGIDKPLDAQKVFNRFYKESSDSASTGLGLAIVKRICDMYKFQLSYVFDAHMHFFTVRF